MPVIADVFMIALDILDVWCIFCVQKGVFMKLANGTEVIVKTYQEENVEEIVNLIIRNFREVNVKDYGEKAVAKLVATHDVNWFKGVAEYAHVYVFWNENRRI